MYRQVFVDVERQNESKNKAQLLKQLKKEQLNGVVKAVERALVFWVWRWLRVSNPSQNRLDDFFTEDSECG